MKVLKCKYTPKSVIVTTPIGDIVIASCQEGLHSIAQKSTNDFNFCPDTSNPVTLIGAESQFEMYQPLRNCIKWLQAYFRNPYDNTVVKPKICPSAIENSGEFYKKIWSSLYENVPVGSTISYSELAKLAGNKHCAQAVGSAMRKNPFSLLIPCHRVICSNGNLGQYGGGNRNKMKEWLVKHECQDSFPLK